LRGIATRDGRLVVLDRYVLSRVHRQSESALSLPGMLGLYKLAAAIARWDNYSSGKTEVYILVFSSVAPGIRRR
jgi:hypothetical protein